MTQPGKIARLPAAIRDELNRRLHDGEKGAHLLEWLNNQLEVRQVLKTLFNGQPIGKMNLSRWRSRGFPDWLAEQRAQDAVTTLFNQSAALPMPSQNALASRAALALVAAMASELDRLKSAPPAPEKSKICRELIGNLAALRRATLLAGQLRSHPQNNSSELQSSAKKESKIAPDCT